MENNLMLVKLLLVCNRNAELLRLVETAFDSKDVSFRRLRKINLIIPQIINKQISYFMFVDT